jgi:hypothetical protein
MKKFTDPDLVSEIKTSQICNTAPNIYVLYIYSISISTVVTKSGRSVKAMTIAQF